MPKNFAVSNLPFRLREPIPLWRGICLLIDRRILGQVYGSLDPRWLRSAGLLLRADGQPGKRRWSESGCPACRSMRSRQRAAAANAELYNLGITFTVYSDAKTIDRILPFDVLPRVLVGRGMGASRTRHRPADHRDQPAARRHLPRAADTARRRRSGRSDPRQPQLPAGDARRRPAAQGLCQHLRHRHRARRKRRLLGARRQCAHPVRGQLCRREPAHDAARLSRSARRYQPASDRQLRRSPDRGIARDGAAAASPIRRSCCCRPAPTTRPISSTSSWPARWACRWSRGRIWWSRTSASACARPAGWRRVDVIYRRINDDFLDPEAFNPGQHAGRARA